MGFRGVSVIEVTEVLRWWLDGQGLRTVAMRMGVPKIPETEGRSSDAFQASVDGFGGPVAGGGRSK